MSRPVKVLFTTPEPHPTFRSEVKVLFGKVLRQNGIQCDLLGVTEGPVEAAPPWGGGEALLRATSGRSGRLKAEILQTLSLFRRLRGYDVVVVRDKPVLGVLTLLAARWSGVRFACWISFPLPEAYLRLARQKEEASGLAHRAYAWLRGKLGYVGLYRIQVRQADWVFAQSDKMIELLRPKGLDHDRVSAVPMGADFDALPSPRDGAPLPAALQGRRVAVYLGTLDRYRHPEMMVDMALIVARRYPDFLMLIIGDTDDPRHTGWLRHYVDERKAGHVVRLTGKLPQAEGMALAAHAEVGLSPFPRSELTEDASPTKAVEYLALGMPVIGNDQPDQAQVIERSGGGWCVPLTPQGFADAVIECLDDPLKARQMAAAGQIYAREHRSYEHLGAEVAERLRALAGGSPEVRTVLERS